VLYQSDLEQQVVFGLYQLVKQEITFGLSIVQETLKELQDLLEEH